MIYLGIDPGYARCGWGVIEKTGNKFKVIQYGCFETPSTMPFPERLEQIFSELSQTIDLYKPDAMGVEELFFAKNTTTAMKVAHARGIILLAGKQKGLTLAELTPNQIKQAATGHGSADKKQMQQMVKLLLNLAEIPKPDDAADALAVAIATATWTKFD
jgi:crossover junction endodeoxyribonuclease RuvC